jgi:hypothetical protein
MTPEQHEAEKERDRRYRETHRELRREQGRRYRAKNGDEIRAKQREWRKTHPGRSGQPGPEAKRRAYRNTKRLNTESRDRAARYGYQWTGPEMEIAARTDLPVPDLAKMLGRTIASVYTIRYQMSHDPRYWQVAGLPREGPA